MTDHFIAIDVETANDSRASICKIGVAAFLGAERLWDWSAYVDPEEGFDQRQHKTHKILPSDVRGAPTFPQIMTSLSRKIEGQTLVAYSDFDQDAVSQAAEKYRVVLPRCRWLDVRDVAKKTWPNLTRDGLSDVCALIGHRFSHHDPLEDAIACATILTHAIKHLNKTLPQLLREFAERQPVKYSGPVPLLYPIEEKLSGAVDGPLFGNTVLLTGDFRLGKPALGQLASSLGCNVATNFSKKVTILICGNRDDSRFGGDGKSGKLEAAEAAIAEGRNIWICNEQQFLELAKKHQSN